jgi:hypothetical protein
MTISTLKSFLISILIFYLSINYFILEFNFDNFVQIPKLFRYTYIFLILIFGILLNSLFKKNKKIRNINWYLIIFAIFSYINYRNINPLYFWETIPDARTYKLLGSSLFSCKKLAMNCEADPYLLFPVGQPLFSGLLAKYFYAHSYLVNLLLIMFVIFIISKISESYYKTNTGLGILYLLVHSLVYELTPMMISEVTFTFLIFSSIYIYVRKFKNFNLIIPLIYGVSLLVRPIGIALLPIYAFVFKKRIKSYLLVLSVLILAAAFNFLTSDRFIVSDFNVDSREDGLIQNTGYVDYFVEIMSGDKKVKNDFINFFSDNYIRLYGESSKDCSFKETCFFYNPKYNPDGTEASYFKNSQFGSLINKLLIIFYDLRSPQKLGIFVMPFIIFLPFLFKRFKIERLFSLSILLLSFPSLLTVEYGNRWNFTILFLTSLIIEMCSSNVFLKIKKDDY